MMEHLDLINAQVMCFILCYNAIIVPLIFIQKIWCQKGLIMYFKAIGIMKACQSRAWQFCSKFV
jgi:hypothetical protein